MLRLRIDLTAFEARLEKVFWRLEPDGIPYKTVNMYAIRVLRDYGITGVSAVTYLDGTFLPESESPMILRDGDLLRILPGRKLETHVVPCDGREPEVFFTTASNGVVAAGDSAQFPANEETTVRPQQDNGTIECAIESAGELDTLDGTDISEPGGRKARKRKRGRRQSRNRSKRVSFDVLAEENGQGDGTPHLESTPFRKRATVDTTVETENVSSVGTRSEAYMTALEATPGISKQSKTPMKLASVRKNKKLQCGVGYYLDLLGSGNSGSIAASSGNGSAVHETNHLEPGPSNSGDTMTFEGSLEIGSDKSERDGSLLSALLPNLRISCDLGMFNVKTSGVDRYPDVTLEILKNNAEKKSFTVRHIEGNLPSHVSGSDFKVDWGMLSSVNIL